MYKYLLDSIDNIDWMAIGPLVLFFVFFCFILIRTMKTNKTHIERMAQLPLDEDQ